MFTALGLVLVIEGLLYALVPGQLRRMLTALEQLSDDQLRLGGIAAIAVGVLVVFVARSLTG
ncbi:MAG: DUF2065 domain-containing protein [Hyphomicrobiales bacterium]